jgi:putative tryptophan/tyrosine transport system substrate-binding protein
MPHRWSRRQVVQGLGAVGLGLLAGCGRLPWQAPAPARVPRIGVLQISPEFGVPYPNNQAFLEGLHELGYVDGATIRIEWRYAEGRVERFPELLAELVQLPVELIATEGPAAIAAAQQATATIPIVMQVTGDPVGLGLVDSLARPGGNVTGVATLAPELGAKRLQQVKDVLPDATRIAVLWNAANPAKLVEFREMQAAAPIVGVEIYSAEVRGPADVDAALAAVVSSRSDALAVLQDALVTGNRVRVGEAAARNRLAVFAATREYVVETGYLLGYGARVSALFRRSAVYVDKILKGAQPADLPVEQPREFDFIINAKTAQALGLTIPQHVLYQATEVIQ